MQEPKVTRVGAHNQWSPPDKEWLEDQYIVLDKTIKTIADEIFSSGYTVSKWLYMYDIPKRTRTERDFRHSQQRTGTRKFKTAVGYTSQWGQKRDLLEQGIPQVCVWCGAIENIQMHHKNHNRKDGRLKNLTFLCPKCHKLETALWHIRKFKKAKVTVANKIITIDFNI